MQTEDHIADRAATAVCCAVVVAGFVVVTGSVMNVSINQPAVADSTHGTHLRVARLLLTLPDQCLLLKTQALHALLCALLCARRASSIEFAKCDTAVLVFRSHLLPLFDSRHTGTLDGITRIGHSFVGTHVSDFNKRNRNQAWSTKTANWLCDKPLGIGLRNDDDGLAGLGFQLVGPLGLEVIHDYAVHH